MQKSKSTGVVEYRAIINLIEMEIKNIKSLGVNISGFETELKNIVKETTTKIDILKAGEDSSVFPKKEIINTAYSGAVTNLNSLLSELDKYKAYSQIISKCEYLCNSQNSFDLNSKELSQAIDELIEYLNVIKSSDSFAVDEGMIEYLYEIVFSIIKLEYKHNGSSKLLSYCKKDKIDSIYISKFIVKEIDSLRNSNYDVSEIDLLILKLNSEDSISKYVDEKLVRAVTLCKEKEVYIKELSEALRQLSNELKSNILKIKELKQKEVELIKEQKGRKKGIRVINLKNSAHVTKSLIPLLLSLGILVGGGMGLLRLFKGNVYKTKTETYSSVAGLKPPTEDYRRKLRNNTLDKTDKKITLSVYEPWIKDSIDNDYNRAVKTIESITIDLEDLEAYLKLNPEDFGYEFSEKPESKETLNFEDIYNEPIYEVTRETQDLKDKKSGKLFSSTERGVLYITCNILALMFYAIFVDQNNYGEMMFGGSEFLENLLKIKELESTEEEKRYIEKILAQLRSIKAQISKSIQENIEINKRYDELMQKPESKKLLEKYQTGISLIEEFRNELKEANKLALKKSIY